MLHVLNQIVTQCKQCANTVKALITMLHRKRKRNAKISKNGVLLRSRASQKVVVYTGKPVQKSNGSLHSVWEASENLGYDLRRCNFSTFSSLFCKFGYILLPPGQILDHFIILSLWTRFFHQGGLCNRLSTQQWIQQQEMKIRSPEGRGQHYYSFELFRSSQLLKSPYYFFITSWSWSNFEKICAPIKWH